jgi:hypothetical protein
MNRMPVFLNAASIRITVEKPAIGGRCLCCPQCATRRWEADFGCCAIGIRSLVAPTKGANLFLGPGSYFPWLDWHALPFLIQSPTEMDIQIPHLFARNRFEANDGSKVDQRDAAFKDCK